MEENFKEYTRNNVAEMRPITLSEVNKGINAMVSNTTISISDADIKAGSPALGDMIARNPQNHDDQWLVAKKYFKDNFNI